MFSKSDWQDYYKDEALYNEVWRQEPGLPFNRYRARVAGLKNGAAGYGRAEMQSWRIASR